MRTLWIFVVNEIDPIVLDTKAGITDEDVLNLLLDELLKRYNETQQSFFLKYKLDY